MPPRKRARTGPVNTKSVASAPDTVADVAPARIQLRDWIDQAYALRHESSVPKRFPLGGSFLDIVQRCWCDESTLVADSLDFVKKLGLIGSDATDDDFLDRYCAVKDELGKQWFNTTVYYCAFIFCCMFHVCHVSFLGLGL